MIKTTQSMRIPTLDGTDIRVLTNWNEHVKSNFLKIVFEGKSAVIPRGSFTTAALLLGNEEEQMSLIPTKTTQIRRFTKNITVKLTKDMTEGSELTIPVSFEVPLDDVPMEDLTILNNHLR